MAKVIVQNTEITVLSHDDKDYISLTDMANGKQSESRVADIIKNCIRTRYAIEFLGIWDMIRSEELVIHSLEESITCPHNSRSLS